MGSTVLGSNFDQSRANNNKLASLGATLVRNYDPLTDLLTGVKRS